MNNARNPSHWTPSLTKPMRCHYLILKGLSKTQSSICKVVWRYICELRTLNIYCWLLRAGEKRTKWWPDHQYKQSCNAEKQLPSLLLSAVVFSVLNTRKLLSCFRITLRFIVTKNPWPANFASLNIQYLNSHSHWFVMNGPEIEWGTHTLHNWGEGKRIINGRITVIA